MKFTLESIREAYRKKGKVGSAGFNKYLIDTINAGYEESKYYCGPQDFTLPANSIVNEECYVHDAGYADSGFWSYLYNVEADEGFVNRLEGMSTEERGVTGEIALNYFKLKRTFMPDLESNTYRTDNMKRAREEITRKRAKNVIAKPKFFHKSQPVKRTKRSKQIKKINARIRSIHPYGKSKVFSKRRAVPRRLYKRSRYSY